MLIYNLENFQKKQIVLKIILFLHNQILKEKNMKTIKVRDLIRMLRRDGWELVKIKGDHRQFKHPTKKGKVTVNKKLSDDLDGDLLDNILKQAGLK